MKQIDKKFHMNGTTASVVRIDPEQLRDDLPAGVYNVGFHPMMGFYLEQRYHEFDLPANLFGDVEEKAEKLMKRYVKNGEVSALLSGAKGSGKTLLAHVFANRAMKELGKAVVLVDNSFENPNGLKDFLVDVGDAVFIFDEFAKNFCDEEQQGMLDFFSGSNAGKRATFVIENRWADINEFMLDRPGRMRFHFRYGKLPMDTIAEVCDFFGVNKELKRLVLNYAARSLTIGMDTLNKLIEEAMIDEVTTKDEFNDLVGTLNIPNNKEVEYVISHVEFEGKTYPGVGLNSIHVHGNGNGLHGGFYNCESHPVAKALIASTDEKIQAIIEGISYESESDEEEGKMVTHYNWYDLDIRANRPTFSMNGELTFIDKQTGIKIIVVEDDGLDVGDIDLLV